MKKSSLLGLFVALAIGGGVQAQQNRQVDPKIQELIDIKDTVALNKRLMNLEDGTEQEMDLLYRYYSRINNREKATAMIEAIAKKFPTGNIAFVQYRNSLYQDGYNMVNSERILNEMQQKFPDRNYNDVYFHMAGTAVRSKSLDEVQKYLDLIEGDSRKIDASHYVAKNLILVDLALAEEILKPIVLQLEKTGVAGMAEVRNDDPYQQGNTRNRAYYEIMDTYGQILFRKGAREEALPYARMAYENVRNDHNTRRYILLLADNKEYEEVMPMLESMLRRGENTNEIKDAYLQAYSSLNPGKSAEAALQQLQGDFDAEFTEIIAESYLNARAPNFELKDINGKTVSLADFKGKTIVLDFWATWCEPCKNSFPMMQDAVDKYKNDPEVEFLFIHTLERNTDVALREAKDYFASNDYNFDLYMDTKDPQTKINPAVNAFKVQGIPAKFVIDGDGIIRFKSLGFSGNHDVALKELSIMVELAKSGIQENTTRPAFYSGPSKFEGKEAPKVIFTDEDGKTVDLHDIYKSNKYTVLDFWASWCVPCRKGIPDLRKVYGEYGDQGLEIVSLSIDKDKAAWKQAEEEEDFAWTSLRDTTVSAKAFDVKAIPTIFIIDQNGLVIKELPTTDGLETEVRRLYRREEINKQRGYAAN